MQWNKNIVHTFLKIMRDSKYCECLIVARIIANFDVKYRLSLRFHWLFLHWVNYWARNIKFISICISLSFGTITLVRLSLLRELVTSSLLTLKNSIFVCLTIPTNTCFDKRETSFWKWNSLTIRTKDHVTNKVENILLQRYPWIS